MPLDIKPGSLWKVEFRNLIQPLFALDEDVDMWVNKRLFSEFVFRAPVSDLIKGSIVMVLETMESKSCNRCAIKVLIDERVAWLIRGGNLASTLEAWEGYCFEQVS